MNPLVYAWQQAAESFLATVEQIPDEAFAQPSLLPGWTIGDLVAHVAALEVELSGAPLPAHEPDWDALGHANDLFSRYTEIGVDYRRGWTPAQVRAELAEVVATRTEQLTTGDQQDRPIKGVGGMQRSFDHQLRMRCFDIFLHELDLRDALDMPEPQLGLGARACVGLMADSLGYVWVKKAGAGPGQVLHFVVPDWLDTWIEVGPDGRGRTGTPSEATTTVTLPVMDYIRLASGRGGDPQAAQTDELGAKVVAGLNVAP